MSLAQFISLNTSKNKEKHDIIKRTTLTLKQNERKILSKKRNLIRILFIHFTQKVTSSAQHIIIIF